MNLSYRTAKRLKDAGFPQGDGSYWIKRHGKMLNLNGKDWYRPQHWVFAPFVKGAIKGLVRTLDNAFVPTLSDLIAACGVWFYSLTNNLNSVWTCKDESGAEYVGTTPEEAVSELYISLNTK